MTPRNWFERVRRVRIAWPASRETAAGRVRAADFTPVRRRLTAWGAAAACATVLAGAFVAEEFARVDQLRDEIELLDARIEQRQTAIKREQRRQKTLSPEQKRIERAIAAQRMSDDGSGLPVVDWIERAWSTDIALTSLSVDKAGEAARIEGGAAELAHIYQFVERLNDRHAERRTGLLQHRTKVVDGRTFYLFSVSVELS